MIILNFYKDGAYIKGHDVNEICTLVSYAMWNCIEDCIEANEDVYHYQSGNDENWRNLGFTYIKINELNSEHVKILNRFKSRITTWIEEQFKDRVEIIDMGNKYINWKLALEDAKKED